MKSETQTQSMSDHLAARRREILEAAKKVFEASGYAAATMESVAAQAGIAKGSIYNYFKSKHELFRTIFLEDVPPCEDEISEQLDREQTPGTKLQRLLDMWYARLAEQKRMGRLILEFWATAARGEQDGMAESFHKMYSQWRGRIAKLIEEGIASGEFRTHVQTHAAAALILAVVDGIWLQTLLDVGLVVDESFVIELKKAVMAGLTSPEPVVTPVLKGAV